MHNHFPRFLSVLVLAGLLAGCGTASTPVEITPTSVVRSNPTATSANLLTPEATAPVPVTALPDPSNYTLTKVAGGLNLPVFLTYAPDGTGRLFILEQDGAIRILENGDLLPAPFLDLRGQVARRGTEQGLLGLAFHPDYARNGLFYVDYTDGNGDTVIERFHVSSNPDQADPFSGTVLLKINQPYANHNGGDIVFGPDGYLYIGMGDGGSGGDPQNRGQDLTTLLGKLLRIDVNSGDPYGIPADNPFVGRQDALPEIWAYGLRNPWRFSFDFLTGDLYIADVGQDKYEEVDFQSAGSAGGQNYGWSIMEGFHPYKGDAQPDFTPPIFEYSHEGGNCSITGGYVYRGSQLPGLQGVYLFGDFCTGNTWVLLKTMADWKSQPFLSTGLQISSFGVDPQGEIYVLDWKGGDVYRISSK